jgi:hypothetical protein
LKAFFGGWNNNVNSECDKISICRLNVKFVDYFVPDPFPHFIEPGSGSIQRELELALNVNQGNGIPNPGSASTTKNLIYVFLTLKIVSKLWEI